MFEKTLTDLVRGIRACKRDTGSYISQCISEIKEEIKSTDLEVKTNALQKMTFLQMMGYSMSPWASFACVEAMSSTKFSQKRVGYLAACQSFNEDTGDVIILCTNLLQKELKSAVSAIDVHGPSSMPASIVYDAGLAVNCLANIVTKDLAQDLLPELLSLLSHPRPYLRKKAVLCLFKIFVKYPEGLRVSFPHIKQLLLEDPDPSVVSCAVNVIAELSDKNGPKNYLLLAPQFFQLLTTSSNNWMLIKVVKLLGGLVSEEPRLARKLLEPLSSIAKNTQAKSLLYEAVYTITVALLYARKSDGSLPASVPSAVTLCSATLRDFVEEADQNLRYLGLVGFGSLMKSHPQAVIQHRNLVLRCLTDDDVTLRTRALELLTGMVTRKNLMELINQLMQHVHRAENAYREDLVEKIILMCSKDKYANMTNFSWYVSILVRLANIQGTIHGSLVSSQLMDVALRVQTVRSFAVQKMIYIVLDYYDNQQKLVMNSLMVEVLPTASWIIGEYALLIDDALSLDGEDDDNQDLSLLLSDKKGPYDAIIRALLSVRSFELSSKTQAILVQSALKVFAACCTSSRSCNEEISTIISLLDSHLPYWSESTHFEVQERAFTLYQMLISLGILPKEKHHSEIDLTNEHKYGEDDDSIQRNVLSEFNGDLLGLTYSISNSVPKTNPTTSSNVGATHEGLSQCRKMSSTLKALLIPEAMKPISMKAQKRFELPSVGQLDAPLDLSIFKHLLDEDQARKRSRISIEEVSFDHQRHYQPSMEQPKVSVAIESQVDKTYGNDQKAPGSSTYPQNAPFYLSGGNKDEKVESLLNNTKEEVPHFGEILLDGFDDSDNEKRSKKKKEKKKRKNDKSTTPFVTEKVAIYDSDDEEEQIKYTHPSHEKDVKKVNSEFQGLSLVDLSEPIGDADILPNRQHRQVTVKSNSSPKSRRKSKKEKKMDKKSKSSKGTETGDLLDLNFGMASSTYETKPSQTKSSSISDAFNSLIDFNDTETKVQGAQIISDPFGNDLIEQKEVSSKSLKGKVIKRPWIKGFIKTSDVGNAIIDWGKVHFYFKVYDISKQVGGNSHAVAIVLRVANESTISLTNTTISLQGIRDPITVGNVSPGENIESSSKHKIGPLFYEERMNSYSTVIKGELAAVGVSTQIKLPLPIGTLMLPVTNVTQDDIANELSTRHWYSTRTKFPMVRLDFPQIIQCLSHFLRAEIVSSDHSSGILAAQLKGLEQVRVMLKEKVASGIIKIEVKSTNESLGKTIVSDMNKISL